MENNKITLEELENITNNIINKNYFFKFLRFFHLFMLIVLLFKKD